MLPAQHTDIIEPLALVVEFICSLLYRVLGALWSAVVGAHVAVSVLVRSLCRKADTVQQQERDDQVLLVTSEKFMAVASAPGIVLDGIVEVPVSPFTEKPIATDDKQNPRLMITSRNNRAYRHSGPTYDMSDRHRYLACMTTSLTSAIGSCSTDSR